MLRFLCTTLILTLFSTALAGYRWENVTQVVDIQADGTVLVTDERTLVATDDDDFAEAYLCIYLTGQQSLTLVEGSSLSTAGTQGFQQPCEDGSAGQEIVVRHPSRLTQSRVRFVYELENTVDVYSDVVQWYWEISGREDTAIRGYDLTVNTPGAMSEPYNAYVHRFSNLEEPQVNLSADRSRLRVSFDRIPASQGLEIRYLMAPNLFTETSSQPRFEGPFAEMKPACAQA